MKKIVLAILVLCTVQLTLAQSYYNEWIDYSKTYYKLTVHTSGLHRISQATLQSAGLGTVAAQNFQLYRNGVQVPIYTTQATGILGISDYIEFCGTPNDGKMDKDLYNDPTSQINDRFNLINDTAAYFLTTNINTVQNLRLTTTANNVAGNVLPKDQNFIYTYGFYHQNMLHPGFAAVVGEYLHASAYDKGEGWTSNELGPNSANTVTVNNMYPDVTSPLGFKVRFTGEGYALNPRTVNTSINGNSVMNPNMLYFNNIDFTTPGTSPMSFMSGGNVTISSLNTATSGNDRMVIGLREIIYPRLFNFDNQRYFEFELAANPSGNYLEISNFNAGSTLPVLYDLTNGRRYIAVFSGGLYRYALQGSATKRNLVMANVDNSNATTVSLQAKTFINFTSPAYQGDYIILTSKVLHNSTASTNAVEKYKAYRASAAGGSFNVKIIDCDDLYDQYGYGIDKHPIALRNYLRHLRNVSTTPQKNILIIGRGTAYNEARFYNQEPYMPILNQVPTFGYPASDILLTADPGTSIQTTPIGRVGAVYPAELEAYLDKVKEYEAKQADMNFTIANKLWMLNKSFVTGSSEPYLQDVIDGYQKQYMDIWRDSSVGGMPFLFTKTAAGGPTPLSSNFMEALWNNGQTMLQYFGHSSATTLEYNLDDPYAYNNPGKYPMMLINGCNAGNYYIYNPFRITTNNNATLSEKYVFAPNRGSIGFVASTHFGVVNYLHYYNLSFYNSAVKQDYGKSIGEIMKRSNQGMFNLTGNNDFYSKMHAEQICLNGDPAIRLNVAYPKPDYTVEQQTVRVNPNFISIAETSFTIDVSYYNLAKAVKDSIYITARREYPDGTSQLVFNKRVNAAYYLDSTKFTFPIIPTRDKGLNKITICVDGNNDIAEMSETNNCVTKEVFIFEDEARPIHPYNYAIVNAMPVRLIASTANPFAANRTYNMELDTTEAFNSPAKQTQSVTQVGGLLEFTPISNLVNNTVYYWRVSVANTVPLKWNNSSFTYLNGSTFGFNQGHYFQHIKSKYQDITLDSSSRKYRFDSTELNITVRNGVWPTAAFEESHSIIAVNQEPYIRGICLINHIMINVFDPVTGKPWYNGPVNAPGQYNSDEICYSDGRSWNFSYNTNTSTGRKAAMDFLDVIPNGHFIVMRNTTMKPWWLGTPNAEYVDTWKQDQSIYGAGNSLYHKLKNMGCSRIDSFYRDRSYIFVLKKGQNAQYTPKQVISDDDYDRINLNTTFTVPKQEGYITSPAFGPAKEWKEVHWRGAASELTVGDTVSLTLIGVRANGTEDSITSLNLTQLDYNIQSINAQQYPYIKLRMKNRDGVTATPWQLNYWRLNYTPIPEGAIAPNITLQIKDTLEKGEPLQVKLSFKNVSYAAFDSIKVKMILLDQSGVPHPYMLPKQKPLAVGESFTIDYTIPSANYVGINNLYIDVNPDDDQPEQFHFNNFLYKNFFVKPDNYNPLLDVTFDGVHILNKDIVSSSPNITIKLKDESRFMVLDDQNDLKIQLRIPQGQNGTIVNYNWNTDTLRFIPATLGSGDNTATAEFKPKDLPDGEYELVVKGKDKSGNVSGELEYKVIFKVINKPMISNLLNYPNPFTSSTAFVFFITGKEVPQNIKIEIMTITGKIVREITKAELGPLRVGRNITDFKWDGTDQFGAKLANGVYLYRVVTNLNGKSLERYKGEKGDKTDQYFNKGYGKMVLIR